MVGIPSFKNAATIGYVVRAAQAGLVQYFPDLRPVLMSVCVASAAALLGACVHFNVPPVPSFGPGKGDTTLDIGAFRAQSLNSLNGKILRVVPSTGDPAPGNPISGPGSSSHATSRNVLFSASSAIS